MTSQEREILEEVLFLVEDGLEDDDPEVWRRRLETVSQHLKYLGIEPTDE